MSKVRTPQSMLVTETLTSPYDEEVTFTVKHATNAEDIARQNLFSKVRYYPQNDQDGMVSERDFPMGDLQIETIRLVLVAWNIVDDHERTQPINEATITFALTAEERQWLYDKIIDMNPIWQAGGRAAVRKNSESS